MGVKQSVSSMPTTFKVVVMGVTDVGKTSFILRAYCDRFEKRGAGTVSYEFSSKIVSRGGKSAKVFVWDTSGQERYSEMAPMYFRDCSGGFLMFDLTSRSSFEHLDNWLNRFRAFSRPDAPVLLIGTKCDLTERQVEEKEIDLYCQRNNIKYFETSSLEGTNVAEAFDDLVDDLFVIFPPSVHPPVPVRADLDNNTSYFSSYC